MTTKLSFYAHPREFQSVLALMKAFYSIFQMTFILVSFAAFFFFFLKVWKIREQSSSVYYTRKLWTILSPKVLSVIDLLCLTGLPQF